MSGVVTNELAETNVSWWVAREALEADQAQALGELLASAVAWRQQPSIAHTQPNLRHVRAVDAWLASASD